MDDSAPIATRPIDATPPNQRGVMGRAIISAGVFGAIGAYIGHLLGRHIRNSVAEPTMKWAMGSFWALIAAYSSFKTSELERGVAIPETAASQPEPSAQKVTAPPAPSKVKVPLSLVEVDTLKDQGQLQEAPELQRK